MIPHGINPVCHRMPISIPVYCTAQKPSRKRKSDGNDSGKSRKKKSTGEKGGALEDTEPVEDDDSQHLVDSEQPCSKPSRRKKSKSAKAGCESGSCSLAEEIGAISVPDKEDSRSKPSRRKKSKSSKAERVTGSCNPAENFDTVLVPDEEDSRWKRSANSLADKLRSPLLQVIEAGDADDFADELEHPVDVHEPEECDTVSPHLENLSYHDINVDLVPTPSEVESCEKVKKVLDKLTSFTTYSCVAEHHVNVMELSTCRKRVRTPPTFEETSAALQAIEEAGRVSPIDIIGLVDQWTTGKTQESATYPPHSAPSDDDLPVFIIDSKPRRKVLNGEMVNSNLRNFEDGCLQSGAEQHTELSRAQSSCQGQKPLHQVLQKSKQLDQNKAFLEHEVEGDVFRRHASCAGEEDGDVLRRHGSCSGFLQFKKTEELLPHAADECNPISKNTLLKNPKTPSRCIPQPEDRIQLSGDEGTEEIGGKLRFLCPTSVSSRLSHSATEPRLPSQQTLHAVDEFSPFDDTNDDQLLAAAVATPVSLNRTTRRHVPDTSANVSGIKTTEDSQLTFTQALACVHDSLNVTQLCAESPRLHTASGKVDNGLETSMMKIDHPQFDLGFELSDEDDNDNDNGDDDDDDIVPPSPPTSSSRKSNIRLSSRSNSLITISRQNSCGSITMSGHKTDQPEDVADAAGKSTPRSGLVTKESDVRNMSAVNMVEHLSSLAVRKSPASLVRSIVRSSTVEVEQKSIDRSAICQSGTVPMQQKSLDREHRSGSIVTAMKQKSTDLTPTSESSTGVMGEKLGDRLPTVPLSAVEMEQKLQQQAATPLNTVAIDQKLTYPVRSNHVAVIHPCIRSVATPTTPADQSEMMSPPIAVSSSTPVKLCSDEKPGEFIFSNKSFN